MKLTFWKKVEAVGKTLLEEAPQILALIMQVEGMFGAGAGLEKKTVVLSSLVGLSAPVLEQAASFIDTTVTNLNAAGVFTHSPKPSAIQVGIASTAALQAQMTNAKAQVPPIVFYPHPASGQLITPEVRAQIDSKAQAEPPPPVVTSKL